MLTRFPLSVFSRVSHFKVSIFYVFACYLGTIIFSPMTDDKIPLTDPPRVSYTPQPFQDKEVDLLSWYT